MTWTFAIPTGAYESGCGIPAKRSRIQGTRSLNDQLWTAIHIVSLPEVTGCRPHRASASVAFFGVNSFGIRDPKMRSKTRVSLRDRAQDRSAVGGRRPGRFSGEITQRLPVIARCRSPSPTVILLQAWDPGPASRPKRSPGGRAWGAVPSVCGTSSPDGRRCRAPEAGVGGQFTRTVTTAISGDATRPHPVTY